MTAAGKLTLRGQVVLLFPFPLQENEKRSSALERRGEMLITRYGCFILHRPVLPAIVFRSVEQAVLPFHGIPSGPSYRVH